MEYYFEKSCFYDNFRFFNLVYYYCFIFISFFIRNFCVFSSIVWLGKSFFRNKFRSEIGLGLCRLSFV